LHVADKKKIKNKKNKNKKLVCMFSEEKENP